MSPQRRSRSSRTKGSRAKRRQGDDDVAPVSLNVGHRWTSAETRAIARGIGGRARAKHYPGLTTTWAKNAARTRWNRVRTRKGLPLLLLVPVSPVMTPRAIEMRERRALEQRRRQYELDRATARQGRR